MLEVEKRFGREKMEGKPLLVFRYSGGVVGSDWCPANRFISSSIRTNSSASRRCFWSNACISISKSRLCSRILSYSNRFFSI